MGFPSPASDYTEDRLSLDEHLILHREATFFVTATGSMPDFGIRNGDLLVVDRAIDPVDQSIVVAVVDGDFTVRQLCHTPEGIVYALPAMAAKTPISARIRTCPSGA